MVATCQTKQTIHTTVTQIKIDMKVLSMIFDTLEHTVHRIIHHNFQTFRNTYAENKTTTTMDDEKLVNQADILEIMF